MDRSKREADLRVVFAGDVLVDAIQRSAVGRHRVDKSPACILRWAPRARLGSSLTGTAGIIYPNRHFSAVLK